MMKSFKARILNQKGNTLLGTLTAVVMSMIGLLALASINEMTSKDQKRFFMKNEIYQVRNELWEALTNPTALEKIMTDPANSQATSCMLEGKVCENVWKSIKMSFIEVDPLDPENFVRQEALMTHNPYDSSTRGFTVDGRPCDKFGTGNCVFRYVLEWKPNCKNPDDEACTTTNMASVRARLEISDPNMTLNSNKYALNAQRYSVYTFFVAPKARTSQLMYGLSTACLLYVDGRVKCWGQNSWGQLGRDEPTDGSAYPDYVLNFDGTGPLEDVVELMDNNATICARLGDSTVTCWGENSHGGLGLGSIPAYLEATYPGSGGTTPQKTTRPIGLVRNETNTGPLTGIIRLHKMEQGACAENDSKEVFCWGDLGNEVTIAKVYKNVPPGSYIDNVKVIFDNGYESPPWAPEYADYNLYAYAQKIVSATHAEVTAPAGPHPSTSTGAHAARGGYVSPSGATVLANWDKFLSGTQMKCFMKSGEISCWGQGTQGLLGHSSGTYRAFMNSNYFIPGVGRPLNSGPDVALPPADRLKNVVDMASTADQACAIVEEGKVVCWGSRATGWAGDVEGMLGNGSVGKDERQPPSYVLDTTGAGHLTDVVKISASWSNFCATKSNGDGVCWGDNSRGQIGNAAMGMGGTAYYPRRVDLPEPAQEVIAGLLSTCALAVSGKVYCWGLNIKNHGLNPATGTPYPNGSTHIPREVGGL